MKLDKIRLQTSLQIYCESKGVARPTPEFRFHPVRKWRFDWAWPSLMIALEYEGLTGGLGGRHQRREGYAGDTVKYNEAILIGWLVVRLTSETTKHMWDWLDRAVAIRQEGER